MGERARRAALFFFLHVVLVADFPLSLSQNGSIIAIGYGWDLEREGHAINTVPLIQNAIASSFIVVPI